MPDYYKRFFLGQILLLFLLIVGGCQEVVNKKIQNTHQYFDLKGLLEEQIYLLDSLEPTVTKTTNIDGMAERQSLHFDSTAWAREMEIFFEVDINDPILRDAYELVKENIGDSLNLESYVSKDIKNAEIEFLKIFYPPEKDIPLYITAVFSEKNALYNSKRSLKLVFERQQGLNILKGYSIEGVQKMLMKDTIFYKVQVENTF